jgi:hypothetical protein
MFAVVKKAAITSPAGTTNNNLGDPYSQGGTLPVHKGLLTSPEQVQVFLESIMQQSYAEIRQVLL